MNVRGATTCCTVLGDRHQLTSEFGGGLDAHDGWLLPYDDSERCDQTSANAMIPGMPEW